MASCSGYIASKGCMFIAMQTEFLARGCLSKLCVYPASPSIFVVGDSPKGKRNLSLLETSPGSSANTAISGSLQTVSPHYSWIL